MKHFYILLCSVFLFSCGISDETYLAPVDPSQITRHFNTSAAINGLRAADNYFLYYKIYISAESESATITPENMTSINTSLNSDYQAILPYTPLNTSSVQIFSPSIFTSRNYYPMLVDGEERFSGPPSNFPITTIDFSTGRAPSLIMEDGIGQHNIPITRSNGNGAFTTLPEGQREFFNFTELNNVQNRDVSTNSSVTSPQYAYCSIYIIKRDIDPNTLSAIYSAPTFVGVFRLPDQT